MLRVIFFGVEVNHSLNAVGGISWESNRTVSGWRPLFDPRPNHDRLKLRIWIFRTSPRWFQNLPIQHYVTAPRYMDLHLYHTISKPPGVSRSEQNNQERHVTNRFTLDTMTYWFGLICLILCLSVCLSIRDLTTDRPIWRCYIRSIRTLAILVLSLLNLCQTL